MEAHQPPSPEAISPQGLNRIMGTGGIKTAGSGKERGDKPLVEGENGYDAFNCDLPHIPSTPQRFLQFLPLTLEIYRNQQMVPPSYRGLSPREGSAPADERSPAAFSLPCFSPLLCQPSSLPERQPPRPSHRFSDS